MRETWHVTELREELKRSLYRAQRHMHAPLSPAPISCQDPGVGRLSMQLASPFAAPDGPPMDVTLQPMTSQSIQVTWKVRPGQGLMKGALGLLVLVSTAASRNANSMH